MVKGLMLHFNEKKALLQIYNVGLTGYHYLFI